MVRLTRVRGGSESLAIKRMPPMLTFLLMASGSCICRRRENSDEPGIGGQSVGTCVLPDADRKNLDACLTALFHLDAAINATDQELPPVQCWNIHSPCYSNRQQL